MTLTSKYEFGDIVYLTTDDDQLSYEVIGFILRPGSLQLEISRLGETLEVYDFQVTDAKDELKRLGVSKKKR